MYMHLTIQAQEHLCEIKFDSIYFYKPIGSLEAISIWSNNLRISKVDNQQLE